MVSDYKPLLISLPADQNEVELYVLHDIHFGNDCADIKKWERLKKEILDQPNRYVLLVGDYTEMAILGSKSDIYTQRENIDSQSLWMQQQFYDLREKILCIVSGNHENRIAKVAGLYVGYDAAVVAGIPEKYRHRFAFLDIGVGSGGHGKGKQIHYFGFVTHRLRDCKGYNGADFIEGIDFAVYGHDHDAKDHARGRLKYDSISKTVQRRDVEVVNSGSFLDYGGYAAENGYRPANGKVYKIVLSGDKKNIQTIGFHI